jgi:nitrogen-specific signal transduction histidine kinase/uncharacterized cupin superfamily protein
VLEACLQAPVDHDRSGNRMDADRVRAGRKSPDEATEGVKTLQPTNDTLTTKSREREAAVNQARRSEAYLAEAQRLTKTGSWAFTPGQEGWNYWSDELFRILEVDPLQGPLALELMHQRVHPEDRQEVLDRYLKALKDKEDYVLDHRIMFPGGRLKYVHTIAHPIFNDAGEITEFVGTLVDVTEQKLIEEALRRSEAYLAEAQRLSHTGSWALDPSTGTIIYYSEEMFRIMGLEPTLDPPDSETIWQRIHPEDLPPIIASVERIRAASKKSWIDMDQTISSSGVERFVAESRGHRDIAGDGLEFRVVLPDRPLKYVRSYGHAIVDKTGQLIELVGTMIDVTERKNAEFERERMRQLESDLAHMNRLSMLGELAASISHELKQPITAGIISASTMLNWLARDEPNIDKARETARATLEAGERAAEIIDHVRALYTKAPPKRELFDGNDIIREMVALLRVEAARYKVAINTDFAAEISMIMSDRVQLQQVLMNLMLNAIEAMKETGGSLSVKSLLNQEGLFQISVSDTGPGLPLAKEKQIFEPFFTTKPEGSGMGLAICRSIIESQGGALWASANRECGVSFHFTLQATKDVENRRAIGA